MFYFCTFLLFSIDTELNVDSAFDLLVNQCKFEPSLYWESLAQFLHVPRAERKKINQTRNNQYNLVLEDCLEYWINHTRQQTWEELVDAVEKCKEDVAFKMRKALKLKQ